MTLLLFSLTPAHGELILEDYGLIGDLLVSSDSEIFFFGLDEDIKSEYWIKDTQVYASNKVQTELVSDDHFAYSTELKEHHNYLIFATLSDECLENVMCYFQDIIQMSKEDGTYKKIITHLKSAVHLSVLDNTLYISESDGKIWKYSVNGSNAALLYQGENIIMDVAADANSIFWIEEINDQNSQILRLETGKNPQVIAKNIHIPYDIMVNNGNPVWNEIQLKISHDKFREYTMIQTHDGKQVQTLAEFENKTPVTSAERITFGPYKTDGTFLFLANNTSNGKSIHLLDLKNNDNFFLENVDYNINYFRNDANNLYVVGNVDGNFLVDRVMLPVTVPEFPLSILILASGLILVLTAFSRQSFHR
jgi:hypothetical protein